VPEFLPGRETRPPQSNNRGRMKAIRCLPEMMRHAGKGTAAQPEGGPHDL